jgi:hypothetical protein
MRNDVDMLFIVRQPEKTSTQVMDQDGDVVQLAGEATGGVRRDDFFRYVVNTDSTIQPTTSNRGGRGSKQLNGSESMYAGVISNGQPTSRKRFWS